MRKVLIVDDVAINRAILEDILSEDYEVESVADGAQALERLETHADEYGLVLLDLVMPKIDGFEVLARMNEWALIDSIPVIVISGAESQDVENRSLGLHAVDFVHKPFDEQVVLHRVRNVYDLYTYKRSLEEQVAAQTESLRQQNVRLQNQAERIAHFNENITALLGNVVEYRDEGSGEHIQRVKVYTALITQEARNSFPEFGLTDADVERITAASVLHDVGKIAIPDAILLKPGRLTSEEYDAMKNHTVKGAEILAEVEGAWDEDFGQVACEIARYHHERYDGRGYPDGLTGDDIPVAAQCVSVADVYDALTSARPYKDPFTPDVAYNMIQNGECGTFSPKMLACFANVKDKFAEVAGGGSSAPL